MAQADKLLSAIEAIHGAGLDRGRWPAALAAMANVVGGAAATFEVIDKQTLRPSEIYCHGVPPANEIKYLDRYAMLNRRLPLAARLPLGDVHWDWRMFEEATIRRDPFYMEFLKSLDLCYFVGGIVTTDAREFAGVCVHRTPRQGHVDAAGIAAMERLLPHLQQAFDVARRLKRAGETRHSLERALDWLADGVMLVRADGAVVYANAAMQAVARRGDGIAIKKGLVEFATAEARSRFAAAMAGIARLRERSAKVAAVADFSVARRLDRPAYLVAIRPLPIEHDGAKADADAIVFVRDPASRNATALRMLREVLDLTDAEAGVAQALQAGQRLEDYARIRAVSIHTVYAHLRSIKDKTGCHRMGELIRKLNDLQVPLRLD
jgi:DNA-binding CsgD family transcriptional regulator